MTKNRWAAVLAAAGLAALLISCGKGDKSNNAGDAGTSAGLLSEHADTDIEEDSEQEENEAVLNQAVILENSCDLQR